MMTCPETSLIYDQDMSDGEMENEFEDIGILCCIIALGLIIVAEAIDLIKRGVKRCIRFVDDV